jgi:hypothetical protein
MSTQPRQLSGALERVGALLEQHIAQDPGWVLGPVERESGAVEGHVRVGFGRSPAHLRFLLSSPGGGVTQVALEVVAKSPWCSRRLCVRSGGAALNAVAAQL